MVVTARKPERDRSPRESRPSPTDPDAHAQRRQEEHDDLHAAKGILLAVILGLLIWALALWLVF